MSVFAGSSFSWPADAGGAVAECTTRYGWSTACGAIGGGFRIKTSGGVNKHQFKESCLLRNRKAELRGQMKQ